MKNQIYITGLMALLLMLSFTMAAPTPKGNLYHDGDILRTVVVPAKLPHGGTDPFYRITDGIEGQLNIAGLAPGEKGYSGGDWAVYVVVWNTEPYLLTSEQDVLDAQAAGDVSITRNTALDFRCPIFK